ncbi:3-methyl-2-oxobutanoate hydroxymethyltransferase [Fertoebacter nigrum]|uniref:3-methyl-2-oxobutanoate hydroxymethyltransferase n=1 Tax=Fertoeibacter niger TaxID=2656921 RepID=A0A8X8H2B6_9RHOB|nr:3-methyl-2-oxobutanoate hydroxymethyltransferase [Fertoeibacter niger]NUB46273.1 3-methyl-2-oxobutanoate hydroxymethyltransferase [Fertoeibacter niger]
MTRLTVADLRARRGSRPLAMLRVETLDEAAAADAAGIDMLSVPPDMIENPRFRQVAPRVFAIPGVNYYEIGTADDVLRWAFRMMKAGADAVYSASSLATTRLLADHGIPVCGHVGLIPSKATWTGGFRAVGKTLESAQRVWQQIVALEDAGAFAAEIEVVPQKVADLIAARSSLFLIGMGAGAGCDAQYLFADDVLGQTSGHVPRHAKVYRNFAAEHARLQAERVAAFREYASDVGDGSYPAAQHVVDCPPDTVAAFQDWLDRQA